MKLSALSSCSYAMRLFQHWISLTASYLAGFTTIYLVQEYTLGFIPALRNWVIGGVLPGRSLVFSALSIFLMARYVTLYSPHGTKNSVSGEREKTDKIPTATH